MYEANFYSVLSGNYSTLTVSALRGFVMMTFELRTVPEITHDIEPSLPQSVLGQLFLF